MGIVHPGQTATFAHIGSRRGRECGAGGAIWLVVIEGAEQFPLLARALPELVPGNVDHGHVEDVGDLRCCAAGQRLSSAGKLTDDNSLDSEHADAWHEPVEYLLGAVVGLDSLEGLAGEERRRATALVEVDACERELVGRCPSDK